MPFLVDSLGMVFARAELAVHLIVHPVLQVRRDAPRPAARISAATARRRRTPESWQLYEIDRQTDPSHSSPSCSTHLEAILADVRVAVA